MRDDTRHNNFSYCRYNTRRIHKPGICVLESLCYSFDVVGFETTVLSEMRQNNGHYGVAAVDVKIACCAHGAVLFFNNCCRM